MVHDIFEDKLDALLKQRTVPEMRSNLAYRIIEASRDVPQEKGGLEKLAEQCKVAGLVFLKGVTGVLDHVALPQPAFAVAVAVFMIGGAVLGTQTGGLDATALLSDAGNAYSYDSSDVETYIMATDSFEYGDFL
jgi:hypothetical protein